MWFIASFMSSSKFAVRFYFMVCVVHLDIYSDLPRFDKNVNLAVVTVEEPVVVTEEDDINPQYSYGYQIEDILTGDIKSQEERRDGDIVTGSYSVVEPDGVRRIVEYTADSINGFNAVLRREPFKLPASSLVQNPADTDPEARIKGLTITDMGSQIPVPSRPSTVHFITPYSNYRSLIPPFANYVPVASVSPQAAQIIGSVVGTTGPSVPIAVSGDALTQFALAASKSSKNVAPIAFTFANLGSVPFTSQVPADTSSSNGPEGANENNVKIEDQLNI